MLSHPLATPPPQTTTDNHANTSPPIRWNNLFKHIDIKPGNVHILDGTAKDLVAECARYEEAIKAHGGIELFLAGMGTDGHIAFNEPGSSLNSVTRIKTLAYETIVANARFFDHDVNRVPKMALTVGIKTILDAKEVLVIVTGQNKSYALNECIEKGVLPSPPEANSLLVLPFSSGFRSFELFFAF